MAIDEETGIEIRDGKVIGRDVNIEHLAIPDCVSTIEMGAFSGNNKLKSVIIPKSITKIYAAAFRNCTSLESITIPQQHHFYKQVCI